MPELPVRTDDVDVERIMEQVRARIEDRRRRAAKRPAPEGRENAAAALPPSVSFEFDENSIYRSSRGAPGRVLHGFRRLLRPLVKFVFNVDPMVHALVMQARLNAQQTAFDDDVARRLAARDEEDARRRGAVRELAAEVRRLSAEMRSHRQVVESVAARLDAHAPAHAAGPHGGRQADERADGGAPAAADDDAPAATAAGETPTPGGGAADAPAGGAAPAAAPSIAAEDDPLQADAPAGRAAPAPAPPIAAEDDPLQADAPAGGAAPAADGARPAKR